LTFTIGIISTGGTIEKTYCALNGALINGSSVLDVQLSGLELPGVDVVRRSVCNLDSLDMSEHDHEGIIESVLDLLKSVDAVVVVHGTDRLAVTGELLYERLSSSDLLAAPVILTGAMRPYELRSSDASQNMTEAIIAAKLLDPGIYCVMHSQVLRFPGVVKDQARGTFVALTR
jgi:L-asparaginase